MWWSKDMHYKGQKQGRHILMILYCKLGISSSTNYLFLLGSLFPQWTSTHACHEDLHGCKLVCFFSFCHFHFTCMLKSSKYKLSTREGKHVHWWDYACTFPTRRLCCPKLIGISWVNQCRSGLTYIKWMHGINIQYHQWYQRTHLVWYWDCKFINHVE